MRTRAWVLVLAVLTVGCSPALNWRQIDLAEAEGLRLRLPCKPDRIERTMRLQGIEGPLRMVMWSCEAAGATWVLSAVRLASVTQVSPALRVLAAATESNLVWADQRARQQAPLGTQPAWVSAATGALQVPGMTPNPEARGWRIQGLKPEGSAGVSPLTVSAWHFSHGLTVFQAAVWQGEEPLPRQNGEDAAEVFLQGLHFPG
jgi:hypothetical protein